MRIDDRFSSTIAVLAQPPKSNFLSLLGDTATKYADDQKKDALDEINLTNIKNKVADDRNLVKYKAHLDNGGNARSWYEEGNSFLTAEGVKMAEGLDRQRIMDKLQQKKYDTDTKYKNAMISENKRKNDYEMGFPVTKSDTAIASVSKDNSGNKIVLYPNGEKRIGGDRNWRNNNPGNIEYGDYAKKHGAIGTDGRFAIFPSMDDGYSAQSSLLQTKNYKNKTLSEAISRYAPKDENNTQAYIDSVTKATGVSADTPMSSLDASTLNSIVKAMSQYEGMKSGDVSRVETRQKPDPVKAKQQALINTALTKEVMGLGDGAAKAEALGVLNDPTMSTANKVKAVSAYESAYPGQSKTRLGEKERWMKERARLQSLPNRTPEEDQQLQDYQGFIDKAQSTAMADLGKSDKDIAKILLDERKKLPKGLQDVAWSEIDMSTLPKRQRDRIQLRARNIARKLSLNNTTVQKTISSITAQKIKVENVMKSTIDKINQGIEFNAIEKPIRDKLTSYFGMSDEQAELLFRGKQAQSFINTYRHALFGSSLSKTEVPEFLKSATTMSQSNQHIAIAFASMMENLVAKADGVREVMGDTLFNLNYGAWYNNLKKNLSMYKKAVGLSTENATPSNELIILGEETPSVAHETNTAIPTSTYNVDYFKQKYGK